MLKKTITYPDLDGNELTEDFYFNLSAAEMTEMEFSEEGNFSSYIQKIVDEKNVKEVMKTIREIIGKSIGRRSEDGKRFIKSPEITEEFFQTQAFDELFMEFLMNPNAAADFVNKILPQDLMNQLQAQSEGQGPDTSIKDIRPQYQKENRKPTSKELQAMSKEEILVAMQWKPAEE